MHKLFEEVSKIPPELFSAVTGITLDDNTDIKKTLCNVFSS
jgi:hypothetical protein